MLNNCNSWKSCSFAEKGQGFYKENCGKIACDFSGSIEGIGIGEGEGQQRQQQISTTHFYPSPSNQQSGNSSSDFYTSSTPNTNATSSYNNNFVGGSIGLQQAAVNPIQNTARHHPYQRELVFGGAAPFQRPSYGYNIPSVAAPSSSYQNTQNIQHHLQQNFTPYRLMPSQPQLFQQSSQELAAQPNVHMHQQYPLQLPYYQHSSPGAPVINPEHQIEGHPPCRGSPPWSYTYCYGDAHNNYEPCHFIQCVDIEDFMNNEKRKEKSRDAARCRRSRETEIFTELAQMLPLKKEDVTQLDKASIMRIAIAYLRIREKLQLFPKIQDLVGDMKFEIDIDDNSNSAPEMASTSDSTSSKQMFGTFDLLKCAEPSQFIKQTLDGFLIVLSNDGDITYVSDNISEYLGIAQIDILGQQIWEYSHQCDHAELKEALNLKRCGLTDKTKDKDMLEEGLTTDHRDLFVRLKCTLTSRGRSINIKSASYKVIHITGHLVVNMKGDRVLIAIGRPIPHPSNIEIPLGSTTFLTKHSLDMKFTYVDDKMQNIFGYKSEDLLDKSMYDCHHGADSESLMAAFKTVLSKGQGETCRYRFLGKYGGYCWITTQATIVYDKMKPQSVVCVNYVISNLENSNEIYSLAQYEESKQKTEETNHNNSKNNINANNNKTDDKSKLNECKQNQQAQSETATAAATLLTAGNKNNIINTKIEVPSIKSSITPSPPPPTIQITTPPPNKSATTTTTEKITNTCTIAIKREGTPPLSKLSPPLSPSLKLTQQQSEPKTPPFLRNVANNNNSAQQPILRENSLPPLHRNLQNNCLIRGNNNSNILIPPKLLEEKRPKSVTASVFRPATAADLTTAQQLSPQSQSQSLPPTATNTSAVLLNSAQLPPLNAAPRAQSVTASVFTPISQLCHKQQQHLIRTSPSAVATAAAVAAQPSSAAAILGQQQQDMNKGFLSFGDDATELAMLKEEPDDLSHLAPNSVDACMRLDDTAPFFGEMFVGLNSYGSFLSDEYSSLDSTNSSTTETPITTAQQNLNTTSGGNKLHTSSNNNYGNELAATTDTNNTNITTNGNNGSSNGDCNSVNGKANGIRLDPFINYREESNDTNCSQHLLSPSVSSKSPEASSLPSLCSPNSLSQDDEFAFMTMSVDEDIDMSMRAPYIPMNEQEDLPLLTVDDLMWCGGNALDYIQKEVDVMQQLQLQQQQHTCESGQNLLSGYNDAQHLNQAHLSNSLCSSPASTASSLSPSPVNHQHQQQLQQQDVSATFNTDTSELAALLCGAGSGTLSILNGNNCGGGGCSESVVDTIGLSALEVQQEQQSHCATTVGGLGDFRLLQLQQQLQAHEQQQRQQQLLGLSIDCKKEKNDNSLTPSLCDSIDDAFDNVYSKDSPNLDCWNELLQINVGDTTSSSSTSPPPISLISPQQPPPPQQRQPQQSPLDDMRVASDCKPHLQLEQQQQSIILNAVPLITIQSNKNIMLQQQQQHQQDNNSNKMIITDEMLPANRGNNKITTIKLVNSATATPIPATTTIRVVESKLPQQQSRVQHSMKTANVSQQTNGNKRHLVSSMPSTQSETKRLKSTSGGVSSTIELQGMPQLLQQLAAPVQQQKLSAATNLKVQQQQQLKQQRKMNGTTAANWGVSCTNDNNAINKAMPQSGNGAMQNLQQQQEQSNSVLKNLLVSGCDVSAGYCIVPMRPKKLAKNDDNSLDQTPLSPLDCLSPSLTKPLHCHTSTASVLRNYRHNPMIGGPGVLPSPPFGTGSTSDDSSPSGFTLYDTESASDSGIDDIGMVDTAAPLKMEMDAKEPLTNSATKDMLLMKCLNGDATKHLAPFAPGNNGGNDNEASRSRKSSMSSLLDNKDLLLDPFLMDLCNDDYNMNTDQFLEANEIDNVLSDWTHEMA